MMLMRALSLRFLIGALLLLNGCTFNSGGPGPISDAQSGADGLPSADGDGVDRQSGDGGADGSMIDGPTGDRAVDGATVDSTTDSSLIDGAVIDAAVDAAPPVDAAFDAAVDAGPVDATIDAAPPVDSAVDAAQPDDAAIDAAPPVDAAIDAAQDSSVDGFVPPTRGTFHATRVVSMTMIDLDGDLASYPNEWPLGSCMTIDMTEQDHTDDMNFAMVSPVSDSDASAIVCAQWTQMGLYLGAEVNDDSYQMANYLPWNSDGLTFALDGSATPDQVLDNDDFAFSTADMQLLMMDPSIAYDEYRPSFSAVSDVRVSNSPQNGGYAMEMVIPWSKLHINSPTAGTTIGFNFALRDQDPSITPTTPLNRAVERVIWWFRPSSPGTSGRCGSTHEDPICQSTGYGNLAALGTLTLTQ